MLLEGSEKKRSLTGSEEKKNLRTDFLAYVVMSYTISLRGNGGFLLELDGINRHWKINDGTYSAIVLLLTQTLYMVR